MEKKKVRPNHIARAAAGWRSKVIEMTQGVLNRRSCSARLLGQPRQNLNHVAETVNRES
jgi:hypothetical protein